MRVPSEKFGFVRLPWSGRPTAVASRPRRRRIPTPLSRSAARGLVAARAQRHCGYSCDSDLSLESDPVQRWVKSLARPGGNVTGVFLDFPDFSAKCLQLLVESAPALSGIGVLWDPTTGSLQLAAVETAARGMGIDLRIFEARRAADIADAFYAVDLAHIQGVLVLSSPLFGENPQLVADVAIRRNVPTISLFPDIAREGGLLAYGQTFRDFIGRPELWCARCCRGLSRQSYRPNGRRDFTERLKL